MFTTLENGYYRQKTKIIPVIDTFALLIPLFVYYILNQPTLTLWIVNVTVPIVFSLQIATGYAALKLRNGNWTKSEIERNIHFWLIASTMAGVIGLTSLPSWYMQKGWDTVGLYNHLKWSYVFYVKSRVIVLWHLTLLEKKNSG
jgi:hypothetical protein